MIEKLEEKNFSIAEIITAVVISIIISLIDRDYFYVAAPLIVVAILTLKKNVFIGISLILINLAIHKFESGTSGEQNLAVTTLIGLSVFELGIKIFVQIRQERQLQIKEPKLIVNFLFALIGISMMYGVHMYRCRNYVPEQFLENPYQRFLESSVSPFDEGASRLSFCMFMYPLEPLSQEDVDFGNNLESLNLIFLVALRALFTYIGAWASVFASLGQVLLTGFSFRRWLTHALIAFFSTMVLGFVLLCFGSLLSFVLGNTETILIAVKILIFAFTAAIGANLGVRRTIPKNLS